MRNYPIIKLVIFFGVGILIEKVFYFSGYFLFIPLFCAALVLLISFSIKNQSASLKVLFSIIISFLIGFYYSNITEKEIVYPFNDERIKNAEIKGEIIAINLLQHQKLSLEINLLQVDSSLIKNEEFRFICNFWIDSTTCLENIYERISIGNIISFTGTITPPKNRRNPGDFDYQSYLMTKGISGLINCYNLDSFRISDFKFDIISNSIFNVRKILWECIGRLHTEEAASLLKGILLADRSDIDYHIKSSFINSGVIHVLAVSGLHVGFIAIIFYLILARFDLRIKYFLTIIGILLFLIITGGHASVFRASTMAILFLISKLTNRSTNGFNSIALAGLILLIIDPSELFNPGFQLSFSAVISILIIYPILSKKLTGWENRTWLKKTILFCFVSISAQLGTLPFTITYFNKLSLISIAANLIVIPAIGIIVAIGITTLIFSIFSFWIAQIFAASNDLIIFGLYYFIDKISNFSFAYLKIFQFGYLDFLLFYLLIGSSLYIIKKFRSKSLILISLLLLITSFFNLSTLDNSNILKETGLSIFAIDVGQGDAILVRFPDNKTALIDAGNCTEYFDNGERIIIPLLDRLDIDRLNYAFISHLDSDHFGGFISLIEKGRIDTMYMPFSKDSKKDKVIMDYAEFNNISLKPYYHGIRAIGNCRLYIMNDTTNISYKNFDTNNKSGIIKIVYGKTSFLFVGDAEFDAEELLINRYGNFLNSDVLKIGHHGSRTGTSSEFLELVNPDFAIISAGRFNRFNHPSESVINKLEERKIRILRTDFEGGIILHSDGRNIQKITWR